MRAFFLPDSHYIVYILPLRPITLARGVSDAMWPWEAGQRFLSLLEPPSRLKSNRTCQVQVLLSARPAPAHCSLVVERSPECVPRRVSFLVTFQFQPPRSLWPWAAPLHEKLKTPITLRSGSPPCDQSRSRHFSAGCFFPREHPCPQKAWRNSPTTCQIMPNAQIPSCKLYVTCKGPA